MRYTHLTSDQIADVVQSLKDSVSHFGLRLNPNCDLALMIRELEWLGSFPADSFQPDSSYKSDKERSIKAFPLFEQASRIAASLNWAKGITGSENKVRHLRKRLNRLETQDEAAQDTLFELEMAQKLARHQLAVEFGEPPEEPDIVLPFGATNKIGLECKRPRNFERLRQRVSEATGQIRRSKYPGLSVIGIEPLFHKSGDPLKPTIIYTGEPSEIRSDADKICDQVINESHREIQAAFRSGILGIVFCGIITTWASQLPTQELGLTHGYIYMWIHRAIANPDTSKTVDGFTAEAIVEGVEYALFGDSVSL